MMSQNSNHLYAIRKRDEQLVFIDDVPNGKKCNCICSKCKDPLVAKNGGKINIHHFAHAVDSNCSGESLAHLKAKEIIKMEKYLWLPTLNEDQKVEFDCVDDEVLIGGSNYRADLICKADNKYIVVEIVVTHKLEDDKSSFILENKINTLVIDLSGELENDEYNKLPDNFLEIVLKTARRYWFMNEKLENEQKILQDKREKKLKHEREKLDKILKVQLQEKQKKRDAQFRKKNNSIKKLNNALNEINRVNNEIFYGTICYADCRKFGGWHNVLCVKSDSLLKSFNNLAFIKYEQFCIYKNHVGEKVGFKIYYESEDYEFEKVIMPFCKIVWNKAIQDKKDKEERIFRMEKKNALLNFKKENKERIKELIKVSKHNPGYTENLVDDFVNKNYRYVKNIKMIEKINWLIINGGLCGDKMKIISSTKTE